MKDKILNIIFKKLCEGFKIQFYTYGEFEKEFLNSSSSLMEELINLTKTYYIMKNSEKREENSKVIRVFREDYIIKCFNENRSYSYSQKDYTIGNLKELEEKELENYRKYAESYDLHIENETSFITPLEKYIENQASIIAATYKTESALSLNKLFWNYFENAYETKIRWNNGIQKGDIVSKPELILENFKHHYLTNEFLQLHNITDKQISDIEFSGLESCVVNIGRRSYSVEHSGWTRNDFEILNNEKKYAFSTSSKNENRILGKYINIFILQLNKRHLLKISITLEETEQTPYIIYKDFEKVSLKNECEILISKHHGNEVIIFDTKKEALEFQAKVIELKEGRNNNYQKN